MLHAQLVTYLRHGHKLYPSDSLKYVGVNIDKQYVSILMYLLIKKSVLQIDSDQNVTTKLLIYC